MIATRRSFRAIPFIRKFTERQLDRMRKPNVSAICAKRALVAGYGNIDEPNVNLNQGDAAILVTDILADLRHLCDALGLDFAAQDDEAYGHYCAEIHEKKEATNVAGN